MSMIALANISDGVKTIGFRIMNIETRQVKDVSYGSVYNALINNTAEIVNLEVDGNMLVGSNGSIDRLPKIVNGQLIGKSPLLVINQISEDVYTVVDFKGDVEEMPLDMVIDYAKAHGIANGKIVNKDGTEFISPIKGEYPKKYIEKDSQSDEDIIAKVRDVNLRLQVLDQPYRVTESLGIKLLRVDIQKIAIVDLVRRIDAETFQYCGQLESVKLPKNLKTIGSRAFYSCKELKEVIMPHGLENIGEFAFAECRALKTIELPDTIKKIDEGAFTYTGLVALKMPLNLQHMGERVFANCMELVSIDMTSKLRTLPTGTFTYCIRLSSVRLPEGLAHIAPSAFLGCMELGHIEFPQSLTTIGSRAFSSCVKLNNIYIPKTVKTIGSDAFTGCKSLKDIAVTRDLFFSKAISSLKVKAKTYT